MWVRLETEPFAVEPGNVLGLRRRWALEPSSRAGTSDRHLLDLEWQDIRFSVSWKAYCFADEDERDAWRRTRDDLSPRAILVSWSTT